MILIKKIAIVLSVTPILFLAWLVFVGPIETIPGFRLGGVDTDAVTDWESQNNHKGLKIETRTNFPMVHKIWYLGKKEGLYIMGSSDWGSSWMQRAQQNPNVRFRIGDSAYTMKLKRVTDEDQVRQIVDEYNEKYAKDVYLIGGPIDFKTIEVFEMVARS